MTDLSPQENTNLPDFRALELPEFLLQATDALGFSHCTEIQKLTLPVIMAGQDVAAQAQTGTGKTAAFLLGSFARLARQEMNGEKTGQPRMLVIAPTRELAIQIKNDADLLGANSTLTFAVAYGGIDYEKQRKQLSDGVDVLVGTPGRLIDYFKQRVFSLKHLEILVLDEADRMFDLGFIADIRYLLRRMPKPENRLSMLFSATLSHRVMELAYEHMNNPVAIKAQASAVTAKGVRQVLYQPSSEEKIPLLLGLLESLKPPRSIIFVNTKRSAESIGEYLLGNEIPCGILSGDVRQQKRQRILGNFTTGELPILIATDVAARGLHIDDVSHVFNFDLPQQAEDYVHRIGRTARAGTEGMAVSFACETFSFSLPEIQEYIGENIPLAMITDELLVSPQPPRRTRQSRTGKSKSSDSTGKKARGTGSKRRSRKPVQREARATEQSSSEQKSPVQSSSPQDRQGQSPQNDNVSSPAKRRRRRRRRRPSGQPSAESTND